jgi:threonine synthase
MSFAFQQCVHPDCRSTFDVGQILTSCPTCGSLLDVNYDWNAIPVPARLSDFCHR